MAEAISKDKRSLYIVSLVFFSLGLSASIVAAFNHGSGRHAGWFYLISLPIFRIVEAALVLGADQNENTNVLLAASFFSSVGLASLLLGILGILKRVNDGRAYGYLNPRPFQFAHIDVIIGVALAIVATARSANRGDFDDIQASKKARLGSAILWLLAYVFCVGISISHFVRRGDVSFGDRSLVNASIATLPFLAVRTVLTILLAEEIGPDFYWLSPGVYVTGFMQLLMEAVVLSVLVVCGIFYSTRMKKGHYRGDGQELIRRSRMEEEQANGMELGTLPSER